MSRLYLPCRALKRYIATWDFSPCKNDEMELNKVSRERVKADSIAIHRYITYASIKTTIRGNRVVPGVIESSL